MHGVGQAPPQVEKDFLVESTTIDQDWCQLAKTLVVTYHPFSGLKEREYPEERKISWEGGESVQFSTPLLQLLNPKQ
ncbi:hypothetical protein Y1Q_0020853 [Alligator mississippiensis]|uniref:Uncharacterized protein n=1 Tax=Alligator mississippiensis TaxID=8496 RepID=A0A151NJ41_ALLMI|nr:hypothetical protein Y1Q_0020853 [Alligator mississippiensis]